MRTLPFANRRIPAFLLAVLAPRGGGCSPTATTGVAVGASDRDGGPALLVTGGGRRALLHNEPVDPADPSRGRKFVDVTERAGLPRGLWTTGAAFGDLDGDGWPDLYLCQYVTW